MILCSDSIREYIENGSLLIDPPPALDQYTTSAVDLRLGTDFRAWDMQRLSNIPGVSTQLNLAEQNFQATAKSYLVPHKVEEDGSVIFPPYSKSQAHLLGTTYESIELRHGSKLAARVEGRSSLARIGLIVHLTAPTIHAGFSGNITLEMINFSPFDLRLVPRETFICQLILELLDKDPTLTEPSTVFQGQKLSSGGQ
jgi:dCTP deaminase